jgi:hypothetical protein
MNFPNVQVINASSRSEFFGASSRWKSVTEITVEGSFLALQNSNGYTQTHSQANAIENANFGGGIFYSSLTVNGVNFGEGYVNSFRAEPGGTDVQDKKYSATIVIPRDGNVTNLSKDGAGSIPKSDFKYLDSFTETSSFSKGPGVVDNYNQSISLSIAPKVKTTGRGIAQGIIKAAIENNQLTSLIQGQYQKGVKKIYEQTYDTVANTYSTVVNFQLYSRSDAPGNSDGLLVKTNVTVEFLSNGAVNITENGECIGNQNVSHQNRYSQAASQAATLLKNAYGRCSSYLPEGNHDPLIDYPIAKSSTAVPFEGKAGYSVTFTNSKEVKQQKGYWEYSISIEQNTGGEYTGTENGTITGGEELKVSKNRYNNAETIWNAIKSSVKSRIELAMPKKNAQDLTFFESHNDIDGVITYSRSITTSDSLTTNQNIRKKIITVTEDYEKPLFSTFGIVGKKEIAQVRENKLPLETTVSIVLNGKYSNTISTYLGQAKSLAQQYRKGGYYSKVSYSFSKANREFNYTQTSFKMAS